MKDDHAINSHYLFGRLSLNLGVKGLSFTVTDPKFLLQVALPPPPPPQSNVMLVLSLTVAVPKQPAWGGGGGGGGIGLGAFWKAFPTLTITEDHTTFSESENRVASTIPPLWHLVPRLSREMKEPGNEVASVVACWACVCVTQSRVAYFQGVWAAYPHPDL